VLFLLCMIIVALAQSPSTASISSILGPFVKAAAYMSATEVLSDWMKHAFISKFNKFTPSIYDNFARRLRSDMLIQNSSGKPASVGNPQELAPPTLTVTATHDAMRKIGLTHVSNMLDACLMNSYFVQIYCRFRSHVCSFAT
jgi:hypothetical protein